MYVINRFNVDRRFKRLLSVLMNKFNSLYRLKKINLLSTWTSFMKPIVNGQIITNV